MKKRYILLQIVISMSFPSCNHEIMSKECSVTNTNIKECTEKNDVFAVKSDADSVQDVLAAQKGRVSSIDWEEQSTNFLDKDTYVNEIKWALLYSRDNKLLTLDSAIIIYSSYWVTKDSIEKWWEQEHATEYK